MSKSHVEIWTLYDLLQAELDGKPYDRKKAASIADSLAEQYPGIQKTMSMIRSRAVSEMPKTAVA